MTLIADLRKDYSKASLDISNVLVNPMDQFNKWFDEALKALVPEPNAMNLATVNSEGKPSSRIVLLKGLENDGFVFYTNYQSAKGLALDKNPMCALNFFWPELERQIRIEGVADKVDEETSLTYFQKRPRGSQVGAWTSPQSSVVASRSELEERTKQIEKKFEGLEVLPKPNQWGGYSITPSMLEFWQGRPNRLHDRIQYIKVDAAWEIFRLAP